MKFGFTLLSILISLVNTSYAQDFWEIDFEHPAVFNRIYFDSVNNPNNIWQIGIPGKTLFNDAHSPVHVIITDPVNPYPLNDTSSFIITHERWFGPTAWFNIEFYYKMDSDTLTDFGQIELSIDNGLIWYNLLTQDSLLGVDWFDPKPVLTGSILTWTHVYASLSDLANSIGYSDTVLFKFTFISDSIQTNKEGWMIDDFNFSDIVEGLDETYFHNPISIYPNPTSSFIKIDKRNYGDNETAIITDLSGRVLMRLKRYKGDEIDVKSFIPGVYFVKYIDAEGMSSMKLVVSR